MTGINRNGVIFFECPRNCPEIIRGGAKAGMIDFHWDNNGIPYETIFEESNKMGFEPRAICKEPEFSPRPGRGTCHLKGGSLEVGSWKGTANKETEP